MRNESAFFCQLSMADGSGLLELIFKRCAVHGTVEILEAVVTVLSMTVYWTQYCFNPVFGNWFLPPCGFVSAYISCTETIKKHSTSAQSESLLSLMCTVTWKHHTFTTPFNYNTINKPAEIFRGVKSSSNLILTVGCPIIKKIIYGIASSWIKK